MLKVYNLEIIETSTYFCTVQTPRSKRPIVRPTSPPSRPAPPAYQRQEFMNRSLDPAPGSCQHSRPVFSPPDHHQKYIRLWKKTSQPFPIHNQRLKLSKKLTTCLLYRYNFLHLHYKFILYLLLLGNLLVPHGF